MLDKICKHIPTVISPLCKNGGYIGRYVHLRDHKVLWYRPAKLALHDPRKSGDLGVTVDVKDTDLLKGYAESPEIADASDVVKRMLSLQFQPRKHTTLAKREKFKELVKRHNLDDDSPEVKIASMTNDIMNLQEVFKDKPKNKIVKVCLNETIHKRKQKLKLLRKADYRRFEYVLERLNLIYKPQPVMAIGPFRKDSCRKLTQKLCDGLMKVKFDEYKAQLEVEKEVFFKEKVEKLAFIRAEEIACGIEPTISEEDIEEARKQAELYQIPVDKKKDK